MGRTIHSKKRSKKNISVTDGIKVRPFKISSVLPTAPKTNDTDLKDNIEDMKELLSQNEHNKVPVEMLKTCSP